MSDIKSQPPTTDVHNPKVYAPTTIGTKIPTTVGQVSTTEAKLSDVQRWAGDEAKIPKENSSLLQSNGEPRYWILYYHYGNIPQLIKSFRLDGTMRDAVLRARKHCDILNIKFIKVRPLIVDLDLQERMYLDGKYRDPSQDE